jgi:hypothetical protein
MVQGRSPSTVTIEDIVMDRRTDQALAESKKETVYKRWEMEEYGSSPTYTFRTANR